MKILKKNIKKKYRIYILYECYIEQVNLFPQSATKIP